MKCREKHDESSGRSKTSATAATILVVLLFAGCEGTIGGRHADDDPTTPGNRAASCEDDVGATAQLRYRTRAGYIVALTQVFGSFTGEPLDSLFASSEGDPSELGAPQSPIDAVVLQDMLAVGERVGEHVENHAEELVSCLGSDSLDCVMSFLDHAALRLYGRPLSDEERDVYRDGLPELIGERGEAAALGLVARTLTTDPNFIYLLDEGGAERGARQLSDREVAVRLADLLTQGVPDDLLLDAAARGELSTPEQVRAQAERLMAASDFDPVVDFLMRWSTVASVDGSSITKDADLFAHWDSDRSADALRDQSRLFFQDLVLNGGDIGSLFTTSTVFVDGVTAPLFDLDPEEFSGVTAVEHVPNRHGVMTLPGVIAQNTKAGETSVIFSGLWVRRRLLCDELPLPVVANMDDEVDRTDEPCWSCHQHVDPIGGAFEVFDPTGRYVGGSSAGEMSDIESQERTSFGSLEELASILAESADVQRCIARQWMRYALHRQEEDGRGGPSSEREPNADTCSIDQMLESLETKDFALEHLPAAFVGTNAFRYVRR